MSRFLYRLGRFAVRRRRLVLAGWLLALVLLVLLVVGGQVAGGTLRDDTQGIVIHGRPSPPPGTAQLLITHNAGTTWQALSFG
jgi:hypothetical protein